MSMGSDLVFGFEACFELLDFSSVAGRSADRADRRLARRTRLAALSDQKRGRSYAEKV
jgi:hypothetical protein